MTIDAFGARALYSGGQQSTLSDEYCRKTDKINAGFRFEISLSDRRLFEYSLALTALKDAPRVTVIDFDMREGGTVAQSGVGGGVTCAWVNIAPRSVRAHRGSRLPIALFVHQVWFMQVIVVVCGRVFRALCYVFDSRLSCHLSVISYVEHVCCVVPVLIRFSKKKKIQ